MKIEIRKSRAKQPFRVRYIAKNGEVLATSENLPTKAAALKNIQAMRYLLGSFMKIWDYTKGKEPVVTEL